MTDQIHVAVIGAGIVGVCCALQLQRDGHRVTIIDPHPPGTQTSFGNAGAISAQSCIPMAGPSTLRQVPTWLLDPLGPLAIRWSHLPRALPWLMRFVAAGRRDRVLAQAAALRSLHAPVLDAHLDLARASGCANLIRRDGALYVYETEAAFQGDAANRALMRELGVEVQELDGHELRQMEPDLAPIFVRATFFPGGAHTVNPGGLVQGYAEAFVRAGGAIHVGRVSGFDIGPNGPRAVRTDAGEIAADRVVIAAGAWSGALARTFGDKVPLESERGYHMVLPRAQVDTRRPITFIERRFMATTMDMGLRLAGTVEFAGLTAEPNWGRAERLIEHARRAFKQVDVSDGSRWMGHRPATPDSLPVIGASPRFSNVLYAFGHGHLGLTGSAVTGKPHRGPRRGASAIDRPAAVPGRPVLTADRTDRTIGPSRPPRAATGRTGCSRTS